MIWFNPKLFSFGADKSLGVVFYMGISESMLAVRKAKPMNTD